jgi:hypothetical protein
MCMGCVLTKVASRMQFYAILLFGPDESRDVNAGVDGFFGGCPLFSSERTRARWHLRLRKLLIHVAIDNRFFFVYTMDIKM